MLGHRSSKPLHLRSLTGRKEESGKTGGCNYKPSGLLDFFKAFSLIKRKKRVNQITQCNFHEKPQLRFQVQRNYVRKWNYRSLFSFVLTDHVDLIFHQMLWVCSVHNCFPISPLISASPPLSFPPHQSWNWSSKQMLSMLQSLPLLTLVRMLPRDQRKAKRDSGYFTLKGASLWYWYVVWGAKGFPRIIGAHSWE